MDILQTFCGPGLVHFLWTFCWDFVFWRFHPGLLLLPFYRENMNILRRFDVVLGVYLQTLHALLINIIQLHFIRAHFINILCCYFVSIYTRILWTCNILHFTEIFSLSFLQRIY